MDSEKTATQQLVKSEIKRKADEGCCRHAYDNRYHKIRAAVGYEEFRAIWFKALESREPYEAYLEQLAEPGRLLADRGITLPPLDDVSEHIILSVRKGTLTPDVTEDLRRIVVAISAGEQIGVVAGDAGLRMARIARLVDEKFRSGNDIPVERITLTRDEVGL